MKIKASRIILPVISATALIMISGSCRFYSELPRKTPKEVKKQVNEVLSQMTLEEKISMLSGIDRFYINTPERLGIPRVMMADGPVGVCFQRSCYGDNAGPSTAYPAGIALAASWDRTLASRFGKSHAEDCRARGVHMILAPGVNIYRAPMCGRNFEYYGEDPFLAGQMVATYIKAVQKEGVMACVKHYCCNNQEWNRYRVSSDVDERTMREIYLPAFKSAVKNAGVWSVMAAYNLVNGIHASENPHILTDILKNDWGFRGFVVSDWGATHSAAPALNAGLDLEMPAGKHLNYKNLKSAMDNGKVKLSRIDDAVRRMLRGIVSMRFPDRPQQNKSIPFLPAEAKTTALQMAREGMVLLKNESCILPLDTSKIRTIAVIGPNADPAVTGGGGSSKITAAETVSLLDGIKTRFGSEIKIIHTPGFSKGESLEIDSLKGEYFNNTGCSGKPAFVRKDKNIQFNWKMQSPAKEIKKDNFSVRWTGTITPQKPGLYNFSISSDDKAEVYLDGNPILKSILGKTEKKISLKGGKSYKIKVKYVEAVSGASVNFSIKEIPTDFSEAMKTALQADLVILSVGFNQKLEHEGCDRTFALPYSQNAMIKAVTAANPNTIMVLNAGGNVDMQPWISNIKALLMAWYPGQEGGTAVAEILAGDVNPSGKLPATFEKRWEDNPCHDSYYCTPGKKDHLKYKEGIFVGYRGYDKNNIKPAFPFGYGLSYTAFKYSNLKISGDRGKVEVSFDITNTGKRAGAEIAQIYVHDVRCSVPRPPKELKGFERVELAPGETKCVMLDIPPKDLTFYDVKSKSWKLEPGKFDIMVGASSRDIRLKHTIKINNTVFF